MELDRAVHEQEVRLLVRLLLYLEDQRSLFLAIRRCERLVVELFQRRRLVEPLPRLELQRAIVDLSPALRQAGHQRVPSRPRGGSRRRSNRLPPNSVDSDPPHEVPSLAGVAAQQTLRMLTKRAGKTGHERHGNRPLARPGSLSSHRTFSLLAMSSENEKTKSCLLI